MAVQDPYLLKLSSSCRDKRIAMSVPLMSEKSEAGVDCFQQLHHKTLKEIYPASNALKFRQSFHRCGCGRCCIPLKQLSAEHGIDEATVPPNCRATLNTIGFRGTASTTSFSVSGRV